MREPMSLLEQVNTFQKNNYRQHLIFERPARKRLPVYSSMHHINDDNSELKVRSFDVYTRKHLVTNRTTILPYSERNRLDEVLLPSIDRDLNHDESHHRRQRRRPFYRKSLFHTYSSMSTQADLEQITARGFKPESRIVVPTCPENDDDNESTDIPGYHHVPPPSPSDNEIQRLFFRPQSRSPVQQPTLDHEEDIPFRLPVLRCSRLNSSSKNIRSTLSNYLQRYY